MRYMITLYLLFSCFSEVLAQNHEWSKTGLEYDASEELSVIIETVNANEFGLTADDFQNKTELRLRQAGIGINDSSYGMVYVNANILKHGVYGINVYFTRKVTFTKGLHTYHNMGATWYTSYVGQTGRAGDILGALDKLLDQFLNEFFKANPKK